MHRCLIADDGRHEPRGILFAWGGYILEVLFLYFFQRVISCGCRMLLSQSHIACILNMHLYSTENYTGWPFNSNDIQKRDAV